MAFIWAISWSGECQGIGDFQAHFINFGSICALILQKDILHTFIFPNFWIWTLTLEMFSNLCFCTWSWEAVLFNMSYTEWPSLKSHSTLWQAMNSLTQKLEELPNVWMRQGFIYCDRNTNGQIQTLSINKGILYRIRKKHITALPLSAQQSKTFGCITPVLFSTTLSI